jgi:hypothetical protein
MMYLTVSSSGYTVSNDGTSEQRSQRDEEGTEHGLIWGNLGKPLKTYDYVESKILTAVVVFFWVETKCVR